MGLLALDSSCYDDGGEMQVLLSHRCLRKEARKAVTTMGYGFFFFFLPRLYLENLRGENEQQEQEQSGETKSGEGQSRSRVRLKSGLDSCK